MKWSLKLGRLLGIDVYLHFTFLLLLAFLGFLYWRSTQDIGAALRGGLFAWLVVTDGFVPAEEITLTGGSFWQRLMVVNIFLVAFNLLPAFPMDGGRVLRALLAAAIGRRRATAIAANIGQGMAILFGIVGFLYNPFLIFIAIFVYLGAQAEAGMVEMQSALEGLQVRDAMMTRYRTLAPRDPLSKAVEELLAGSQQDFPVTENEQPVGILRRNDLVKALSEGRRDTHVNDVMCRECETVDEGAPLRGAVESMHARQCATVPVVTAGRITGLLTLENISEMISINAALAGEAQKPTALAARGSEAAAGRINTSATATRTKS